MVKLALVLAGSALLAWLSRASLLHPASHGFTRFFAWEGILLLFVLQVELWFTEPFSWHQILSWILLIVSILPLGLGVAGLGAKGRQKSGTRTDPSLYAFEKTTELVTDGIYLYIRHPLYASLLFLAWGIFFKEPTLLAGGLGLVVSLLLFLTARRDEAECLAYFGEAYRDYMGRSKRFLPFLF